MPKVYKVRAKVSTYYSAYVQVPDDWLPEDITDWYEYNGTSGEFTEKYEAADWDWRYIEPELVTPSDYDGEPDMIFADEDNTDWPWKDSGIESDGFVTVHPKV